MVSLLTDLVKTCVEKLIDGAIAETRYVCCFTSIAKEFEEEQARLQAERRTVGQRANVASRSGHDIAANAQHWEEEADQLIQEDTKTKQKCFFGFCPDCVWRYKRGKKLADKIVKMKRLVDKGDKLENIEIPRPLPDVEFHSSQNYIHFKGRESEYKELLEALKDENNFITGLHGMGGSGKTTLAKKVGKELKQSENFAHVIDATVSYTPNIKKIQDDIAGPLGLSWEDCNESDRPKKLWSRLTNGEKILVILDDVWDRKPPLDFDAIGIPKQDNHKGCRVLVTTRNKRVLNKMGCDEIIKLEVLSEEDSQIMFESYAGITNNSFKSLIDKGRKIADECKRLPVAIAAVASSLKGQESLEEWDVALKSLQDPLSSIQGDDESLDEIYNCLKFSYDYLKDEKAKRLFLLCSVFPEDGEIAVENFLTRLCIGAGLFGEDYGSYNDARNQVVVAINKLLDSCLLLEVDEGLVKMHDLVRDAAQLIANQEIRTVNMSHKYPMSLTDREKNTKYLFWEGKVREMFSSSFCGSKLEILIASLDADGDGDCVEVPNSFFENMARLRALVLFHKEDIRSLSLPQSIRSLANIRSLFVFRVDLGDISVLGNLHCLETLDLVECKITELPHEITKLEKFKLLKLEDCEIKRNNPFEVIGRCISLEELYFQGSFNDFCREINFPKLQRYVVSTEEADDEWDVSLSKCVKLSGLENLDIFSEATIKYFIQTTEFLKLESSKWQWRNIMPEIVPVDQGMNDLVHLDLSEISELQYLIKVVGSRVPNVFSKLVVLTLFEMENLEELCNGPISFDSLKALEKLKICSCINLRSLFKFNLNLCNLKSMRIDNCPLLVSLFQLSTAKSLMMLEELEIKNCEQLESIITDEKRGEESKEEILVDDGGNDSKKHSSMFQKLKALNIRGCPQLEFILPFLYGDLPVLETISIESCDKLKYIFDQFVKLDSLKELMLYRSPNFIAIFPESGHPVPLIVQGSSSTSSDGFKAPTQLDPIKCNVFSWTHKCCYGLRYKHKSRSTTTTEIPLVSKDQPQHCPILSCFSGQPQILCNITTIELSDVSKIKSVLILSITPTMLVETLIIRRCGDLKHIIVDIEDNSGGNNWGNVFPRLKKLTVRNCVELEYIFGHYADDHQSHNEIHLHLPELESLKLWYLPNLVAMCPKQYHTTFPSLVKLELDNCIQVASKSIGDFISHTSSTSLESMTMKELSGNVEHLLSLEVLIVKNSKVENVFFLNETNGQQLNLMLQYIALQDLHVMTYLFVGSKSSVTLQNLTRIEIERCEKLEIIFSTSVVRCLPQLIHLRIEECKELKHIIEDDAEDDMGDEMMSNFLPPRTCFPKLETLLVVNCNKLEFVFPASISKELHKLKVLMIREADALQEIFRNKDAQKVEIPNLKVIVFVNLPSLSQTQAIQFQNVEHRLVENCQKLSLTSVSTLSARKIADLDSGLYLYIGKRGLLLPEDSEAEDIRNENPSAETTKDLATGIEVQATSEHEPFPSPNYRSSLVMNSFKTSVEEGTTLVNAKIVTSSTHLESISSSSGPLVTSEHKTTSHEVGYGKISIPSLSTSQTNDQRVKDGNLTAETSKDFSVGVEVQAALGHELTSSQELLNEASTSQKYLMSQQHPVGEIDTTAKPSQGNNCLEETKDQSIQEALISEKAITTVMRSFKRSVEEGTTLDNVKTVTTSTHLESISSSSRPLDTFDHKTSLQDDEIRVSEPKPSPTTSSLASQCISKPYEGNPSQIVENLCSSSLITWELQQLVSKKHLASENLSLLTDFLVKHPSVHLRDNSLSNRYKGYAYNCLAELLRFLQTHSMLDVLESSRSEYVELLQDARSFGFDKDWFDGVEKRALFPNLQVSQDALEKLLHSKQQVSQHVEDLKHQLTSSEAVLKSIIQQEALVLESRAALSAPLGY